MIHLYYNGELIINSILLRLYLLILKVLIGIPCLFGGGTEIQTLNLVEALVAAGHFPVVACYFEYDPRMVRRYEDAGAKVYLLNDSEESKRRAKGIWKTAKFLYKGLKEIVRKERPDVAHVQYMAPGALAVLILRYLGIKKIIATSHTDANIYGKNGLRIIRFLTQNILSGFQTITLKAENNYFGNSSLFDGELKKHFTIYNSLPSHIEPRPSAKVFNDTVTIGVVSRLEKIKGMDLVIPAIFKALSSLKEKGKVRILIVGDGSLSGLMKEQAKEYGLEGITEFAGRQPQDKLQSYYDQIDILLMPSRSEGFGLTAIEGMARGCVPVVADTGGLPEVVTPGSGLLHNPEDMDDMAKKISYLIIRPEIIKNLSKEAILKSIKFSKKNYYFSISKLYSLYL